MQTVPNHNASCSLSTVCKRSSSALQTATGVAPQTLSHVTTTRRPAEERRSIRILFAGRTDACCNCHTARQPPNHSAHAPLKHFLVEHEHVLRSHRCCQRSAFDRSTQRFPPAHKHADAIVRELLVDIPTRASTTHANTHRSPRTRART